jgi:hypothetical protein
MSWADFFTFLQRIQAPSLGYKEDPPDGRDLLIDALGLPSILPSKVSLADPRVPVRSQGPFQSCVGYAITTALDLAYLKDKRNVVDLSAEFVYYNARRGYTTYPTDVGTYIREGMRSVVKLGCPPARLWTADAGINRQPSWNAYRYAYQGKGLRGYYRILRGDTEAVRKALAAGRPIVGGWKVDQAFLNGAGPTTVGEIRNDFIGGHAMVIDGYDRDKFRLHNSWGTSWREGGKVWVTEGFVARGYDLWAVDT